MHSCFLVPNLTKDFSKIPFHVFQPSNQSKPSYEQCNELYPNFPDAHELRGEIDAMGGHLVDVTSHMHPCPYTVHPCSPLPPVFNLFRTMGLRHLPVVNKRGEVQLF